MKRILLCFLIGIGVLLACSNRNQIAGTKGGSETTNGIVASLVLPDGSPAAGVTVFLRPADYLPNVSAKIAAKLSLRSMDTTITDSLGGFFFDSIAPGIYTIECLDGEPGNGALIDSVVVASSEAIVELRTDTLKPLGTISGHVDLPESLALKVRIRIYGLDRVAAPVSAGVFEFRGLAEGTYTLRFDGPTAGTDLHDIKVEADSTTRLAAISTGEVTYGSSKVFVHKTSGPVVIDGILDDFTWNSSTITSFDGLARSENSVNVRVLWDTNSIYVAYEVTDTLVRADAGGDATKGDAAEFYFDALHDETRMDNEDDLQVIVDISNNRYVLKNLVDGAGQINSGANTTAYGYTIETSIPWALLGITPAESLVMGVLFASNDLDQDSTVVQFDWLRLKSDIAGFKRPYLWGDLILMQ